MKIPLHIWMGKKDGQIWYCAKLYSMLLRYRGSRAQGLLGLPSWYCVDAKVNTGPMFQEDTACMRLECCRHLHKLCLHNLCPIPFLGKPAVPPYRLAGCSAPHKSGRRESNPGPTTHTNKHTPVIWIRDLCHKQINKKQTSIRCNHTHTHTLGSSEMHTDKTVKIQTWLEMHHSHTHTHRKNNTKHRQHNNPSQTNQHPSTHKQQSTKGQKQNTSNQHKRHQKQYGGTKKHRTQHPTDIITIQGTKLTQKAKTPKIPHYTTIRTHREHKQGGGLITLIKDDITFTNINIPKAIHTYNTELQLIKIQIVMTKDITVANTYSQPRDTTSPHYNTMDTDIAYCIRHVTKIPDLILTGDVNAH